MNLSTYWPQIRKIRDRDITLSSLVHSLLYLYIYGISIAPFRIIIQKCSQPRLSQRGQFNLS